MLLGCPRWWLSLFVTLVSVRCYPVLSPGGVLLLNSLAPDVLCCLSGNPSTSAFSYPVELPGESCLLLWVRCKMSPTGSYSWCVSVGGTSLREPLGGGAKLWDISCWKARLQGYSLACLPSLFPGPLSCKSCTCSMCLQLQNHLLPRAFLTMANCIPANHEPT